MFGTALEVVIGLIFIYLMISLVVSAVNELFANFLKLRAKTLELGLDRLLQDDHLKNIKDAVYAHPVLQGMTANAGHRPSYIPGSLFTLALIDVLAEKTREEMANVALTTTAPQPPLPAAGPSASDVAVSVVEVTGDSPSVATVASVDPAALLARERKKHVNNLRLAISQLPKGSRLRKALETLVDESVKDIEDARRRIEGWFDSSMERVSGWYKRKMQIWILCVGAVIALACNVDTIRIAEALAHDSALRASLVTAAERTVKDAPGGVKEDAGATAATVVEVAKNFEMSNLPVGWSAEELEKNQRGTLVFVLFKLFGLLLTTLAVTQGAPFWFDMLNRVVNVRSVGRAPSSSTTDAK